MCIRDSFEKIIGESQDAWRRVIVRAVEAGIPTPVFSSSLAYYDGLRSKRCLLYTSAILFCA